MKEKRLPFSRTTSIQKWIVALTLLFAFSNSYAYHTQTTAYDFVVDGIYYKKNADNKSVTVWYNWDNPDYSTWISYRVLNSYSGEVTVPEKITYNDVEYAVTAIGEWAFYKCDNLTKVHLPASVTSIGALAFSQSGLTEVNIPSGVTSIMENTFDGCKALESFEVPEGIISIGAEAFQACQNLTSITLPSTLLSIGDRCFKDDVFTGIVLPENLETIGVGAFYNCSQLTSLTLPSTITSLPNNVFYDCAKLNLHLPSSVISAGYATFFRVPTINVENPESWVRVVLSDRVYGSCWALTYGVPSSSSYESAHVYYNGKILTEYTIPDGITTIPDEAFRFCKDMQSLNIPSSVKSIGNNAFRQCFNLAGSINLSNIETIGKGAFFDCTSLEGMVFGSSLKTINASAFSNCDNITTVDIGDLANWCGVDFDISDEWFIHYLKPGAYSNPLMYAKVITLNGEELDELVIPSTVKEIKKAAFNGCCRFSTLTIPNSVETIGEYAFIGCSDLETIKFGKKPKLTKICDYAFRKCTSLTSVTLPESVTDLGGAFYECSNLASISLPSQITEIADYTFYGCTNLKDVNLPVNLISIGNRSFYNCSALEKIEIPRTVGYFGTDAFYQCTSLNAVYISDLAAWCKIGMPGQWEGGGWAVYYNNNNPLMFAHNLYLNNELVTDLVIPDGVEAVEAYTFAGATCLKKVTFPEGCKRIGGNAFTNCANIEEIHFPMSMTTFEVSEGTEEGPFSGSMNNDVKVYIEDLETWITNLGPMFKYYFNYDSYYANLYLNGQLVTDLVVPNSITSLGDAFQGFSFKTVTIPSGLKSITTNAFCQCNKIQTIYSRSKFAPIGISGLSTGRYYGQPALSAIYVPYGRANNYKLNWTEHASIIQEVPENVSFTGEQTSETIAETLQAHKSVYGTSVSVVDLSAATLGEDVTAETLIAAGSSDGSTIFFLPEGTEGFAGDNIVVGNHATKIVLHDGTDFTAPCDFTADEVIYERSIGAYDKQTMCLPYTLSTLPGGLRAYTLDNANESNELAFAETHSITANMPYLVIATEDIDNLNATNVSFKATPAQDDMEDGGCNGVGFYGVLKAMTADEAIEWGGYTLRGDMTWRAVEAGDGDAAVLPMRAFLSPDDYPEAFTMSIGGNTVLPVLTFTVDGLSYRVAEAPAAEITGGTPNADGEVTIPETVTYDGTTYNVTAIASNTFNADATVNDIYMESATPLTLGRNALQGTIVHVPNGSLSAYKAAEGWSELMLEEIALPYDVITIGSLLQTTYCSRYDLDFSNASGIRAYILPSYDTKTGQLVAVRLNSVPAGTGVLIKADVAGTYQVDHSKSYTYCLNLLRGTLEETTISETDGDMVNYVFANGASGADFYSVVGTRKVSANKAYLQVPAMVAADVKQMSIRFDEGETTGIYEMRDEGEGDAWFDLNGRKLQGKPAGKGIYLNQGKKVIIK